MKRADRLGHFRDHLDSSERSQRERVLAAEGRLVDARARLHELQKYRNEYCRGFGVRASGGIGATALQDYQAFVARIVEAMRQQEQLLSRAEVECGFERQRWHELATRSRAVASVIEGWRQEDRVLAARVEQKESDEWARQLTARCSQEMP